MYGNSCGSHNRELDWLRETMNNLFSGPGGAVHEFPPVNVWTHENGAVIKAELPGVDAAELNISVLRDTLTLKGVRQSDALKENERFLRRERLRGEFSRALKLPFQIDGEGVKADYKNGVLTVTVARAEADKPRKIELKAA